MRCNKTKSIFLGGEFFLGVYDTADLWYTVFRYESPAVSNDNLLIHFFIL